MAHPLSAFRSPSAFAHMDLGDRFEGMVAFALGGRVVKKPAHDVVAADRTECKSRTRGSDGRSFRIALYEKYFDGETDSVAFGYFDEHWNVEKVYLVPIPSLEPHWRTRATMFQGSKRWRPTRRFIKALPGARDITSAVSYVESLLPPPRPS